MPQGLSRRRGRSPLWVAGALVLPGLGLRPAGVRANPTQPNELTNDLVPPTTCDNCHEFDNPAARAAEPPWAPYNSWRGSMMANAARDPVFWAGVAIAEQDFPAETDLCVRCHSPRAFLEGRGSALSTADLEPEDLDGVECEACHRMVDEGVIGNAQYTIDDVKVGGTVPRRGPYTYSGQSPPHNWIQDPFIQDSALCGTCHDVTTPRPRLDGAGVPTGTLFNEQRTYSEWLNSDYSSTGPTPQTCQDCHMPQTADFDGCQAWLGNQAHASGGRHDLAGANRFMVELLKQEYGSAGTGEIADAAFDSNIARIDEQLAAAASLSLAGPASVDLGAGLAFDVTVTNDTGHKLPTGYSEGRIMWLEIEASYAGQPVYTSGTWDAGGRTIEPDAQLRTYVGEAEQYGTGTSLHLLLNDHWVEDTRIPPRGLVADPETDPVGSRYTLLGGGVWPHWDTAPYAFGSSPVQDATPGDPNDDTLDVTVRLRYLINTDEYIDFLAAENTINSNGAEVQALFAAAGGAPPLTLETLQVQIPITAFAGDGDGDGDGDGSTGDGDGDGATGDGDGATGDGDGATGDGDGATGDGDGATGDGDGATGDGDGATGDGDGATGDGDGATGDGDGATGDGDGATGDGDGATGDGDGATGDGDGATGDGDGATGDGDGATGDGDGATGDGDGATGDGDGATGDGDGATGDGDGATGDGDGATGDGDGATGDGDGATGDGDGATGDGDGATGDGDGATGDGDGATGDGDGATGDGDGATGDGDGATGDGDGATGDGDGATGDGDGATGDGDGATGDGDGATGDGDGATGDGDGTTGDGDGDGATGDGDGATGDGDGATGDGDGTSGDGDGDGASGDGDGTSGDGDGTSGDGDGTSGDGDGDGTSGDGDGTSGDGDGDGTSGDGDGTSGDGDGTSGDGDGTSGDGDGATGDGDSATGEESDGEGGEGTGDSGDDGPVSGEGCDCSTGRDGGAAPTLIGFGALFFARRRRRSAREE